VLGWGTPVHGWAASRYSGSGLVHPRRHTGRTGIPPRTHSPSARTAASGSWRYTDASRLCRVRVDETGRVASARPVSMHENGTRPSWPRSTPRPLSANKTTTGSERVDGACNTLACALKRWTAKCAFSLSIPNLEVP
jgi:hypothetical protein